MLDSVQPRDAKVSAVASDVSESVRRCWSVRWGLRESDDALPFRRIAESSVDIDDDKGRERGAHREGPHARARARACACAAALTPSHGCYACGCAASAGAAADAAAAIADAVQPMKGNKTLPTTRQNKYFRISRASSSKRTTRASTPQQHDIASRLLQRRATFRSYKYTGTFVYTCTMAILCVHVYP